MPRPFPNWNEIYGQQQAEKMPWYYEPLDPDLERALAAHGVSTGTALDLGTGPATQAYALAKLGFRVTASDLSTQAVDQARGGAAERGLTLEAVQDDILATRLHGPFDLVLDRGCFHVLEPSDRAAYARTLSGFVPPGGWFFLKCFSDEQPGEIGPYQSSPADIAALFGAPFEVVAIERTIYQGTLAQPPKALFCSLRRR
jgi:2-polyprenyl-3-methyl-5-hydroxy-6-metoxy-1,4-benzoquinol methylase